MAVYDLEEQDQLDDLKAWWTRWGNAVTTVALVIALALAGWQAWRWYSGKQAEEASALFAGLAQAARTNDLAKAKDAVKELEDRFARSGYASRGALILARMQFDAADTAAASTQLQWVIDRADEIELKEIARYRMAEVHLHQKQYDEALKVLDAKHGDAFAGLYADLRGDALAAAGRTADARTAYETALAKLDAKSPYRTYVQVKLQAVGGSPAAVPAAAGGGSSPAPVAAPAAAAAPVVAAPNTAAPAPAVAPKK
ncbi:MAG: tetratricopeptide repeat protein [Betaproteobacteria bacterium]